MTRYEPGEVVLLAFPFSDQKGRKQRPALVVIDTGDADFVVARISTQQQVSRFDVPLNDWHRAGLLAASVVRPHKLATIEKALVARTLGRVSGEDSITFWRAFQALYCQPPPNP